MFDFLTELAENNNKEWFDAHKAQYESAKLEATTLFKHIYSILTENDTLASLKYIAFIAICVFLMTKHLTKRTLGAIYSAKNPTISVGIMYVSVRKRLL